MKFRYFAIITLSCLFVLASFPVLVMADAKNQESGKTDRLVQEIFIELKKAIQKRDFDRLRSDVPDRKVLSWGTCESDSRINLSFEAMVNKLGEASTKGRIIVNETPVQPLYLTIIETKGWATDRPYLYFEFKEGLDSWRWLGVYDCDKRSSDFQQEQGEDMVGTKPPVLTNSELENLTRSLKKAIEARDFKKLRSYVPLQKIYYWASCGPGDTGFSELYFEDINRILKQDSKGVRIYIDPTPELDSELSAVSIETDGWASEYPFITFNFELLKTQGRWIWSGVCYSAEPPFKINQERKYESKYFREPQFPRPGPRIFKDKFALLVRIKETLKFKAFDALSPYAIKQKLIFGECSQDMINDEIKGNEVPIDQIIDFLKKNAVGAKEFKFARIYSYLHAEGWCCEFPFVYFRFTEGQEGWEWTGVAYCRTSLSALLFPDKPGSK